MSQIPSLDSLRNDLVTGVRDANARRSRRHAGFAVTACVGLVLALLTLPQGQQDALAITQAHGYFEVRVRDATADPDDMNRQLADAGIPATVILNPVPAEFVGQWTTLIDAESVREHQAFRCRSMNDNDGSVCVGTVDPDPVTTERFREMDRILWDRDVVRIPRDFKGKVELEAGRPAREGENVIELFEDVRGERDGG